MLVNTRIVRIEWGDCDPAGIVYYPRYLAIFDACTSALFERALGMTKYEYLEAYDFAGHPLVNVHARFIIPTRFALGFMVSMDNRAKAETDSAVLGEHAFGHVGAGGSIGFADPSLGLSFGYSMNRMGPGILLNERGQSLVDAAYAVLGAR